MRFTNLAALLASIATFGACSGNADHPIDSTATSASGSSPVVDSTSHGAPITGRLYDVRMLFDGARYYFEPAKLSIRQGDGVRWIMVSGAPHNVEFLPGEIPAGAEDPLAANMPRTDAPLTGPMLLSENELYVVSFAGVPKGSYGYICTPHQMVGMKGSIEVE